MRARLRWSYVVLTTLLLLALAVPLALAARDAAYAELAADARRSAETKALLAGQALDEGDETWLATIVEAQSVRSQGSVVILDAEGGLLAATPGVGSRASPSSEAPRVATALRGDDGGQVVDTGDGWLAVAVPIEVGGRVIGAVDVGLPTLDVERRMQRLRALLVAFSATAVAVVWLLGGRLASWASAPLVRLQAAVRGWAAGELTTRARIRTGPPELRDLGEAFDDMAGQLERLLAAQRSFVADVSHELRLPLATYRMCLANLEPDVAPHARGRLHALDDELAGYGRRLDDLLLLATSHVETDALQLVDASEVVASRVHFWRALSTSRRVELAVAALDEPPADRWVWELPGGLGQILDNLVSNALKVTPPGGSVTLRVDGGGGRVEVHVVDEGPGMSPEERSHAFERSWRAERTDADGEGLGLAIVRRVAEAMDAKVQLRTASTGGVDAVVVLPAVDVPPDDGPPDDGPSSTTVTAGGELGHRSR